MLKKTRPDGTLVPGLPHFTRLLPYLMGSRTDSTIFFEQDFDITHALRYVKEKNQGTEGGPKKLTFFQVFLCAAARTLALRPKLNRFVSGYNYYQRNRIIFNFVAKKDLSDQGAEINITIPFSPDETLTTLPAKVSGFINRGKSGPGNESDSLNAFLVKLPRWVIRLVIAAIRYMDYHNMLSESFIASMPFWASIFFTNVGSVGIDAPFHHNFNIGTCGFFIALGKIRRECITSEAGAVELRDRVKVTFTYDDRIVDGIYCGRAIDMFRTFVENPEQLEKPPELSADLRAELMLKE
ncbi:MAG: 2-oxo acid dehydrogenase subunit E2 [Spirochaetia bacterium]|jgi:hypothetical protein